MKRDKELDMLHDTLEWALVALGYLAPAAILALGLRPAGELVARWGRASA